MIFIDACFRKETLYTPINAAKNFGLSVEARGGIPFYFIQSKFSKAFGTPRLNIYSIGVTFTFYDFTRFLG
ncbi:hypothetical protein HpBT226_07530 [Helicobacter pylori]